MHQVKITWIMTNNENLYMYRVYLIAFKMYCFVYFGSKKKKDRLNSALMEFQCNIRTV